MLLSKPKLSIMQDFFGYKIFIMEQVEMQLYSYLHKIKDDVIIAVNVPEN